ncbi:MAG TPA: peptidoglycan DD-metalloendopeptidase family protein [Gammaproteobacteria bacterium]|nr:peptidoglycan DD-metalloendopeptidase family protein [Gammaproteobacteria bacterium]
MTAGPPAARLPAKLLLPLALSLVLVGCASSLVEYPARVHIVQPGETLFAIAFRYGLDYHDLARWNRLEDANLIQVGQRLRLTPPASRAGVRGAGRTQTASAADETKGGGASAARSSPSRSSPPPLWQWPTDGQVVSTFGSDDGIPTGISIAGRLGQPIDAAAAGRVVYAGSGLIGYGKLIIIRHNDTYLTAYGHNSRLLVRQGQTVARGQEIAEMGLGPRSQPRLHFEIRRHGMPVDPLRYLSPSDARHP